LLKTERILGNVRIVGEIVSVVKPRLNQEQKVIRAKVGMLAGSMACSSAFRLRGGCIELGAGWVPAVRRLDHIVKSWSKPEPQSNCQMLWIGRS